MGTNPGWFAGQKVVPTVEELAEHIEEVRDLSTYQIPLSSNDEIRLVMAAMQRRLDAGRSGASARCRATR